MIIILIGARLPRLNREIAAQLRPCRGSSLGAGHDFAPSITERYGLKADFPMDVPEVNPSPADLQRVAVAGRRSRLQALLREPRPGNRSRPAPTADPGLRVARFDSLETGSATACHDPAICSQVMRNNMTGLHRAFAP